MPNKPQDPQKKNLKVKQVQMNFDFSSKRMIVWAIIGLLFLPFFYSLIVGQQPDTVPVSQLVDDVRNKKVEKILVTGDSLEVKYQDASKKVSLKESQQDVYELFNTAGVSLEGVEVSIKDQSFSQLIWDLLIQVGVPAMMLIFVIIFLLRQARGTQDGILGFGKSKAKIFIKGKQDVKFADVGGMKLLTFCVIQRDIPN